MALAFVQQAAGIVTDGGTLAFGSNVGSNTLLVACLLLPTTGSTVSGITDTLGNTWARARHRVGTGGGAGTNRISEIWYAACPTGGANTITLDTSAAGNNQVVLAEFSGFTSGVSVDQVNDNENMGGVTTHTAGSITTTIAEAVLISTLGIDGAFTVSSRLSGWNALTAGSRRDSQYKITASTETTDGQVTMSVSTLRSVAVMASFYTSGGGGGFTGAGRVFGGISSPLSGLVVR